MSREIQVRNPRTGVADYAITAADGAAIAAATATLRNNQPAWQAAGFEHRCGVLREWAAILLADQAKLLEALSTDTGRHLVCLAEIGALPSMLSRWHGYAQDVLSEQPERPSATPGIGVKTQLVPFPVVGVISPWNFPFLLSMIDAIPALVAGSAVVIKPSEVTPRFVEPLLASLDQVPELAGVFTLVTGDGATGAALIEHVDAIAFTGSVATGRKVAEACAENFIPVFLELGGKDPAVILSSADPVETARPVLRAAVQATGQACQSLERIYVHESIHEPFLEELVARALEVELSFPDIHRGHLGPLIFERQAEIITAHLADAVGKGARILCGGEIEHHGGGKWIRPTVLTDVTHDMVVMRDETFGPVIPVMSFSTVDEAVALANDSAYGLSAAVFGADLAAAELVARRLHAGAVSINDGALTVEVFDAGHTSFNFSGLGASRSGPAGLERFFRQKALMIRHGEARGVDSINEANAPN
jgi:acyl-CoA reductase-like NAD-dependent aldehyde dehydrogenase